MRKENCDNFQDLFILLRFKSPVDMYAVSPKEDCPHHSHLNYQECFNRLDFDKITAPCLTCGDASENWLCLECDHVFCSRYVKGHMSEHNAETNHSIALSFSDGSFWCYSCDSYVNSSELRRIGIKLGRIKFPDTHTVVDVDRALFGGGDSSSSSNALPAVKEDDEDEEETAEGEANPNENVKESAADAAAANDDSESSSDEEDFVPTKVPNFTREHLIDGIKNNTFQRVVFLTGAGISVAAGIPDFRTPGTGLYAKVKQLGLPYPEAIFSLDYLRDRPEAFFKMANGFLTYKAKPVKAHYFIRKFQDEGKLFYNFTQNIDGLELEAGVSLDRLVQAHGHMRTAHCIDCSAGRPMEDFYASVSREEVLYCNECNGIVKPDIVFFGEQLPFKFSATFGEVRKADLVIVMGTSLKVFPFAGLMSVVDDETPVVLLNRENPGIDREKFLFIQGNIEDSVEGLVRDFEWELLSGSECSSA